MSSMSTPLVVAKDVRKSFQHMGRTLDVLRGIDLSIDEGEMLGVVGQSGAGKSTFLHCIGTLDVVTSGSLKISGQELTTLSGARLAEIRNRTIGFVFQFHHLLPEFSALENVTMPGLIQGRPQRDIKCMIVGKAIQPGAAAAQPHCPATGKEAGGDGHQQDCDERN